MVALPRLVVAAPATSQGKSTIATGLMAALRSAGHEVSGHKVGPDYIDPGYHALATGRPGRNLDPHLVGEEKIAPLLLHGAMVPAPAEIAVIEGVMGLYDGRLGTDGFASTAHVAKLTGSPVVLVLDVARLSRSAGAIVAGMASYDPEVTIAGVVLNRAAPGRNTAEIIRSMERTGIPVLGTLGDDEQLSAPSRHLGLVPAAERDSSIGMIEHLGKQVTRHLDLEALLRVARSAPVLTADPWEPADAVRPVGRERPVVAVAGGRAFTFRYTETEELLRAAGCETVPFDPLLDTALPANTSGIYLGGGFPEMYVSELAANRSLLHDLRAAVAGGIPTVAECAGLLYLAESLDGAPMADVVPTIATMSDRLTLRYPSATAAADSLLTRGGEEVTGHEFHRTRTEPVGGDSAAWNVDGQVMGFTSGTLHASYLHVHWAGHPQLAQRFADAVHSTTPHVSAVPVATFEAAAGKDDEALREPLRHHGDTEADAGLLDFAVNAYCGEQPGWLNRALHESIDSSGSYPDAELARHAVSRHHGRGVSDVLVTAGAAEAFSLIARLHEWRKPVVVHPQFTEPHAALEAVGHTITPVICRHEDGFALDPASIPAEADLVFLGNPTNPTGILHPASVLREVCRPGRLVVVDEAFMDAVPDETESLIGQRSAGVLVIRSLTKHWAIPGIRAGYLIGDGDVIRELSELQPPWPVSAPAIAATVACTGQQAAVEARERAANIVRWRDSLERGLRARDIEYVVSAAPFVLARLGAGVRLALRDQGIAVRRADTFPGLDASWARIAVRQPTMTERLCAALDRVRPQQPSH